MQTMLGLQNGTGLCIALGWESLLPVGSLAHYVTLSEGLPFLAFGFLVYSGEGPREL